MLDLNKPVQTRDGKPARIICTDCKGKYPIVALITSPWGRELAAFFTKDGNISYETETDEDLVNVPEKRVGYINVYNIYDDIRVGEMHKSREEADEVCGVGDRIARIRIEFEEGQFDE